MPAAPSSERSTEEPDGLAHIVDRIAHLLPAQGPISVFIHHNTLHALEDLPFEDAVIHAREHLGCEPFLSEERYRAELASGRIVAADFDTLLAQDLGAMADERIAGLVSRRELCRRVMVHGIPETTGPALHWILQETNVLRRFRTDLPSDARDALTSGRRDKGEETEQQRVDGLWKSCMRAAGRTSPAQPDEPRAPVRHRDLFRLAFDIDTDSWVHPMLVRFLSAYLDQGLAYWPMPDRQRGIHACFLDLYGSRHAFLSSPWMDGLDTLVADDRRAQRTGLQSLADSLEALGVAQHEWEAFLGDSALALRGWAGMVRQLQERPDRIPSYPLPTRLEDFLAVRLLLDRAALMHAAKHHAGFNGPLSCLRAFLKTRRPPPVPPCLEERAWPLFHTAQLCGLDANAIDTLSVARVQALESEILDFGELERRRILHLAYERSLRNRLYDALSQHEPQHRVDPPSFQAIFCIDEREESIRRHLEEVEPSVETVGSAGFFGVAMYHRGEGDAHPRPLCPVAIRPDHYVEEREEVTEVRRTSFRRIARRRFVGVLGRNLQVGSRTFVRGALFAVLGVLALIPLVFRVLFPRLTRKLSSMSAATNAPSRTRLHLERTDAPVPLGTHAGFTEEEMAAIVRRGLEDAGLVGRLSPLVVVVGHGSSSLNNPHESAHDCGACGGGHGGPNARAFAQMANARGVRQKLSSEGLEIPNDTWFVGAERNTCSSDLEFFDVDVVPDAVRPLLARAHTAFEEARAREAHERCRRFESAPTHLSSRLALAHVQARASDLAQPRPEYGHATNAFCIVGRRARTAGLFLDRRAFLVSYDPTTDPTGDVIARLLSGVVPVIAGIGLEYYFGAVDPTGYGSGTKLPHNVVCLLGVMDGAQSDLRTGLPWQMLEIHEPVRPTIVVECAAVSLLRAIDGDATLTRLVHNRWIIVARLDPETNALWELGPDGFEAHQPQDTISVVRGTSRAWYEGKRGHLPIARIQAREMSA